MTKSSTYIDRSTYLFYGTVFCLASVFIWFLLLWLNWPLLASVPLAICLMIQLMYLSKKTLETWKKARDHNQDVKLISYIKAVFTNQNGY